jgi:succinate dehydrogenase / fumarate reductase cytochrome b subunit
MSDYRLNRHFLLRRLHSLLGLLPVGAFLIFHLWENSQSRFGAEHYNEAVVGALQRMNYLPLLEIFAIALPLLLHAGYGLVILKTGNSELKRYPWLHNRFYWLQRLSGLGILLFLLFHVGMTRFQSLLDPTLKADLFGHMQQILSQPAGFLLYLLGLALSVFHLGNGLWTMGISWGVTVTPQAQQRSFILCMGLTLLLFAMGLHGLWGFVA